MTIIDNYSCYDNAHNNIIYNNKNNYSDNSIINILIII